MVSPLAQRFEAILASGKDNALLRFSLGNEYLKAGETVTAATHLAAAVEHDPGYSAAWKLYGAALARCERLAEALEAYRRGITAAQAKGDMQAAKEMTVFARRIEKQLS